MESLGIYIHVPYCVRKCRYCDFCSHTPENDNEVATYFEKIRLEIMQAAFAYRNKFYVNSIFFGGGTPSLVPAEELVRTLKCVQSNWRVAEDCEISLEANPGTIDREKLQKYKAAGFNRISLGVQSFNDDVLTALGRIHDSKTAISAFEMLPFGNRNIDLMFGVPGQNLCIWEDTLNTAIALNPEHISFYSLQLEDGTPLFEDYKNGQVELPSWEENRKMYHMAVKMLKDAGYHHYEVSNAAKPGYECRHNLKYWKMQSYLGFGESAWSYLDGRRGIFNPNNNCVETEDEIDTKGDFIFTELRLIDGFNTDDYFNLFGTHFENDYKAVLNQLISEGLLEQNGKIIRFTERGLDYTNPVMERLLNYE